MAAHTRIALITGASRGIGRALAVALARQNVHVVALARTQGALEELDDEIRAFGGKTTLVPCDLADHDALDRLGAILFDRYGRLDILVGNGGILGPLSPLAHVSPKDWGKVLSINVTANWRLIRSLDPLLRASASGRVLFITSSIAHRAHMKPYWGSYAASKAALETIALTYAEETRTIGSMTVMLANPGPLRTRMRAQAMPGEDPSILRPPEDFVEKILPLCSPEWRESGKLYDFPSDRLLEFSAPT